MLTVKLITALALGYLFGSIPFGLLLTRLAGTRDLREIGSGNIGATNVLRTGRKGLAAATLICDALKGTFAVLIGGYMAGPNGAIVGALGAFLGHLFPLWLRFRGGKGVATYIGVLIGLLWPAALAFCAIWLIVAVVTRYSSAAALIASAATPLCCGTRATRRCLTVFPPDGADLVHAPGQHRAADVRHGIQDRVLVLAVRCW